MPEPPKPVPVVSSASPVGAAAREAAAEMAARATPATDDRHFSHLAKSYFQSMFAECRRDGHWPVRHVWLGVKGAAYAERANGRKVNPNWMVETADGRRWTNRGPAEYDTRNMRRWDFADIAAYAA